MIGYKENLPEHTLNPIEQAIERTSKNTGMILNFAINYGSRKEILQSIKHLLKEAEQEKYARKT